MPKRKTSTLELADSCASADSVCCIDDPSKVVDGKPSNEPFEFKSPNARSASELPRLIGTVISVAWDGGISSTMLFGILFCVCLFVFDFLCLFLFV